MASGKATLQRKAVKPPARPVKAGDGRGQERDALSLLKADHRQVAKMLEDYEDQDDDDGKEAVAEKDLRRLDCARADRGRDLLSRRAGSTG